MKLGKKKTFSNTMASGFSFCRDIEQLKETCIRKYRLHMTRQHDVNRYKEMYPHMGEYTFMCIANLYVENDMSFPRTVKLYAVSYIQGEEITMKEHKQYNNKALDMAISTRNSCTFNDCCEELSQDKESVHYLVEALYDRLRNNCDIISYAKLDCICVGGRDDRYALLRKG